MRIFPIELFMESGIAGREKLSLCWRIEQQRIFQPDEYS
ncbi:hypothetical protein TRICHSKD4_5550 [Roseibium sp. TrichSKD4]|nr:hypothetical protein TRICHSKD4_5550 [Roseibium sp. TrichSKD4]